MSVASVTVTGTLALPSGQPAVGAAIWFTLSNPGLLGITVVLPITTKAVTDLKGFFSITIAPNVINTYYIVAVYKSTGAIILETVAIVPYVDCKFSQIIQVGKPTTLTEAVSTLEDIRIAKASVEQARVGILETANTIDTTSKASLFKFKEEVDSYKSTVKKDTNNFVSLIDNSIGITLDLVLAYQLSK